MKRIVICADGTWNNPEENLEKDFPTNVLKFSRAITPLTDKNVVQSVFYDWGIGSYHSSAAGGALGSFTCHDFKVLLQKAPSNFFTISINELS